jgi:hypothetical protein
MEVPVIEYRDPHALYKVKSILLWDYARGLLGLIAEHSILHTMTIFTLSRLDNWGESAGWKQPSRVPGGRAHFRVDRQHASRALDGNEQAVSVSQRLLKDDG